MNDEIKRLLELAAKAAGYTGRVEYSGATGECLFACDMDTAMRTGRTVFLPHDDDGDSRRLEVAAGISVQFDDESPIVWAYYLLPGRFSKNRCFEEYGDDPCAATRLAVLRAAAAKVEAMP